MDKRTYESPMDWEYQHAAPMDPSSPFAQSSKQSQNKNIFSGSSGFSAYSQNGAQNGFARTQSSPSKPLPPTPSIFHSARAPRTATAPAFRNATFTTPQRSFDTDALSELSTAESSPAATDGSDFVDTPDHDRSVDMAHMTITPARQKLLFPKKASGRGEIAKTIFPTRDKVRKRKRYNADKDISGYRLPYIQSGEGDDPDYESDESTYQPNGPQGKQKKKRSKDGWLGGILATIARHPYAPSILGYWLNFVFSLACVSLTLWFGWAIIGGLREDFAAARSFVRDEILDEMAKCRSDYIDNKCAPVERRLPAMFQLCEQWYACMNKNPDHLKKVQLGAKNIVEIINEIVDTMSYKTIALLVLLFAIFLFSGRSLYKTAHDYPDYARHAPPPPAYGGQPHPSEHAAMPPQQQVYWQAIQPQPQTPRHNHRRLRQNEETPETDASPRFRALLLPPPPPETPTGRRSPSRSERERARSPTKSRSPTKFY